METQAQIKKLFESIDKRNVAEFLEFLSDDVHFRFGNAEPVKGNANVGNVLEGFLKSIKAISHDIIDIWEQNNVVICHGVVNYTRHDDSTLIVPFANILKMNSNLIKEYLIYVDISELYNNAK